MSLYYATFPAGTFEIISKHLKSFKVEELKIEEYDESSVIFQSTLPVERLIELRYFTNVYLVIDNQKNLPNSVVKGRHFRLMALKGGEPQVITANDRVRLEARIKRDFNFEPNTHLSRNDFYLIERASGTKLFALKLSRAKFKRDKSASGELRPELAHILCLVAGVKAKDVVADVFAGYGSIPYEAVRGFGCKQVIAVDNQKLPNRHEHPFIEWHEADARTLDFIRDNSIDRVVTDPPWGIFENRIDNLYSLYADFTKEVLRILKPGGITVVLSGYGNALECFSELSALKFINSWNVLISGKKAVIYKLQKS